MVLKEKERTVIEDLLTQEKSCVENTQCMQHRQRILSLRSCLRH